MQIVQKIQMSKRRDPIFTGNININMTSSYVIHKIVVHLKNEATRLNTLSSLVIQDFRTNLVSVPQISAKSTLGNVIVSQGEKVIFTAVPVYNWEGVMKRVLTPTGRKETACGSFSCKYQVTLSDHFSQKSTKYHHQNYF